MSRSFTLQTKLISNMALLAIAIASLGAHAQTPASPAPKAPAAASKPAKEKAIKMIELAAAVKVGDQVRYEVVADDTVALSKALADISVATMDDKGMVLSSVLDNFEVSRIQKSDDTDKRVASAAARAFSAIRFDMRIATAADGSVELMNRDDVAKQVATFETRLMDALRELNPNEGERERAIALAKAHWVPALAALPERIAKSFSADTSGVVLPLTKLSMPMIRTTQYDARVKPNGAADTSISVKGTKRLVATVIPNRYEIKSSVFVHGDSFQALMSARAGAAGGERQRKAVTGMIEINHSIAIDRGNPWPFEIETNLLSRQSEQAGEQKAERSRERLSFVMKRSSK